MNRGWRRKQRTRLSALRSLSTIRFLLTAAGPPAGITLVAEPDMPFTVLRKISYAFSRFCCGHTVNLFLVRGFRQCGFDKGKTACAMERIDFVQCSATQGFCKRPRC